MPDTQTQTAQSLSLLIQRSEVIGDPEKQEFLDLLPSLLQPQIDELTDFFLSAEKEVNDLKAQFDAKKSELYGEYLPRVEEFFEGSRQIIQTTGLLGKFKNP